MRINILLIGLTVFTSCTTAKLSVPESFQSRSTAMPVKGLNGWMVNQQLAFGNYQTSRIKRGWDFRSSLQYTKFSMNPEEAIMKVFDIETDNSRVKQKNKFQYTIEGNNSVAEVYATESFTEKQLVYKSNNPWIGSASKTRKYEYAFTSVIIPLTEREAAPWSLVLINTYDIRHNAGSKLFERPQTEEEGYATNGGESMAISPVRVNELEGGDGKEKKVLGGNLLAGYHISVDNKPIAMADILSNTIWIANDLEPSKKIIVASIASAILLKRIQDVEKDTDEQ